LIKDFALVCHILDPMLKSNLIKSKSDNKKSIELLKIEYDAYTAENPITESRKI